MSINYLLQLDKWISDSTFSFIHILSGLPKCNPRVLNQFLIYNNAQTKSDNDKSLKLYNITDIN